MTYDPEAAERLVAILTPLITEQSCGEWDDKTINEDVQMFLPPLLTALQEARNAALREAADLCVEYSTHHGTGMFDKHSHACSEAILALIDTPAPPPPAPPAGDAQPITMTYRNWCGETGERTILPRKLWFGSTEWHPEPGWLLTAWDCDKEAERVFSLADCQFAALAAAPAPQPKKIMCSRCDGSGYVWAVGNCPDCNGDGWVNAPIQPAPQPDADEREAMVYLILDAMLGRYPGRDMARAVADALLAAGWARKREGE